MKKIKIKNNRKFSIERQAIIYIMIIVIGFVFLTRLFYLQIIKGDMYKESSSRKILRTVQIEAPRGEIYDRNGILLATNKLSYDIYIYRVGLTHEELNLLSFKLINVLEQNEDKIINNLPIENSEVILYNTNQKNDLKYVLKLEEEESLEETNILEKLLEKYELNDDTYSQEMKEKIAGVRYEIERNGYSLFRSVCLAKDISYNSMAYLEEIKSELKGIEIISSSKRYYPNTTLMAHTLGYVSNISSTEYEKLKDADYSKDSVIGKMGIESSMEKYLKGENGIIRKEVTTAGEVSAEYVYKEAISGSNVYLTIDYRLQTLAEDTLKNVIASINTGATGYVKRADATSGAVIVQNVNTGEILAIASYPTYDLNLFVSGISYSEWNKISEDIDKPMFNRAISGTYSPGSTYKMVTAFAGLETGKLGLTETITDLGVYPYGHHPTCWIYSQRGTTHGTIDVSEAIKVSCNYFFYEVGRRVGIDEIVKYSKLFGLGDKTGIELLGESKGTIAGEKNTPWYIGDTLSAAIGQSYNLYTPLQLSNYISTIANGGSLNKVTILKNIIDINENTISSTERNEYFQDILGYEFEEKYVSLKEENKDAIIKGMKSVTTETGGTSYIVFKNSNIEVAGKTGTAEVPNGNPNAIFVGFAPIVNPEIAVVVILEHASSGFYGANVAKPIFSEYFNILNENKTDVINMDYTNPMITY